MIEVDFKDRLPKYPGRVKMTPVTGQMDVFEMVRMDEPTEPGTPLDKATFDSIIKSRLTGRFYEPSVLRQTVAGFSGLTTSPIPSSGWVYDSASRYIARSGSYVVEVSSDGNTDARRAAAAFVSEGWTSVGGLESWIEIYHSQALNVKKIRFSVELQYTARLTQMAIQGSTNGTGWQSLGVYQNITANTLTDFTLENTGDFNYYRILFTSDSSNRITVKNLSYSLYDVSTYANYFTLDKMPTVWDRGQRLTIQTPTNVNSFAVDRNFLNNISISTILLYNKRYELRYNGTTFEAKEV